MNIRIEKVFPAAVCMAVMLLLAGCAKEGDTASRAGSGQTNVQSVLEQGMAQTEQSSGQKTIRGPESMEKPTPQLTPQPTPEPEKKEETEDGTSTSPGDVDVDLTKLSATMVYTEVYNMMCLPEDYIGKKIRMKGIYAIYLGAEEGKLYHACIITDATACCAQGIEFELTDDYRYPDDYPEENTEICVSGTFDTYQEGEMTYCTLRNACLEQ